MNSANIEEFINPLFPPLYEKLKKSFLQYLKMCNQNNEIIESAKQIDFKMIIKIYNKEFIKLWNKYDMPKNIKFNENKKYFYLDVYENILFSICYFLLWSMKNDAFQPFNKNNKIIGKAFANFLSPFYFLIRLNENDKELLKELAERGNKFIRKKEFNPKEIPIFEKIQKEYDRAIQTGLKKSYKTIAYYFGRTELNFIIKEDQHRLYKRFLDFKKTKQK